MKRGLLVLGLLACAALALTSGAAAQARDIVPFVVTVPFAFTVNDVTLPAGKYTFEENKLTSDAWDFVLTDERGAVKVIFGTEAAERYREAPKYMLTFDAIGDQHFLSRLWLADSKDGFYVPKCHQEREMMKEGAKPTSMDVPINKK